MRPLGAGELQGDDGGGPVMIASAPEDFTDVADEEDRIGVVTGLAWTESGGDILFVEATRMAGGKNLILTGSLGEVMQESAKAALITPVQHAMAAPLSIR